MSKRPAETTLHKQAKNRLMDRLNEVCQNSDISIHWNCSYCPKEHIYVIPKGSATALETKVNGSRPDVSMFYKDKPIAAFEIVVTHAPEDAQKKNFRLNGLPIFEFKLRSENDLELLLANPQKPSKAHFCMSEVCSGCGNYKYLNELRIVNNGCWCCGKSYFAAVATYDWRFYGPDRFSEEELKAARSRGVIIENRYSKMLENSYEVNVCPHCNQFHGSMFTSRLLDEEIVEAIIMPFRCLKCEPAYQFPFLL